MSKHWFGTKFDTLERIAILVIYTYTPYFSEILSLISKVFINIHDYGYKLKTSDSLNERLPIKMARKKFQRKRYFSHEKDSRFYSQIFHKSVFSHRTSTN